MEKRRHKRISLELPVVIRSGGRLIPATALNLSSGGMYLKTDTEIKKNSAVEVTFDLDEENRDISLSGTVARVDKNPEHCIGVQFGNFFSSSHKALREYLRGKLN
jgi:uncharacterized protein (TIGR02266 family)